MGKKINIGPGTDIDLDNFLETRGLIQSNSGGGKSGIVRVIIEESNAFVPFILLDKKGEYYPLKEKLPDIIIIGGMHADIPLSLQAAAMLPKAIVENGLSVIIDLSGPEMDNDKRADFIGHFLKALNNLSQKYWTDYLIFIEEAHLWCGQQDKLPCGKYIKELMSEGRKMGYCGVLVTQRISKLHKDAAAEANNKFIGRTFLDIDMDRSAAELGIKGSEKYKLRDLKPQHFYAFGTSIEPHNVHEVIVKNAKTRFIKRGASLTMATRKPTSKILAALAKLNELPQQAAKEMKDIQHLQAEVKRLNGELGLLKKEKTNGEKETIDAVRAELKIRTDYVFQLQSEILSLKKYTDTFRAGIKAVSMELSKSSIKLTRDAESLSIALATPVPIADKNVISREKLKGWKTQILPGRGGQKLIIPPSENSNGHPANENASPRPKSPFNREGQSCKVSGGEKAILVCCAQYEQGVSREQLTVMTGYKRSSRDTFLQRLKQAGLILEEGKLFVATDAGIVALGGDYEPPLMGEQLRIYWLNKLGGGEKKILEILIDRYPSSVSREELTELTGYQRSSRDTFLQRLSSRMVVSFPNKGQAKASDLLFKSDGSNN